MKVATCREVTVSPDGSVVALSAESGVDLFDIATGRQLATLGPEVWRITFSPADGAPTLVASRYGAPAELIRTDGGAVIATYGGYLVQAPDEETIGDTPAGVVVYSADGRLVFVRVEDSGGIAIEDQSSIREAGTGKVLNPVAPIDPAPMNDPGSGLACRGRLSSARIPNLHSCASTSATTSTRCTERPTLVRSTPAISCNPSGSCPRRWA